MNVRKNAYLCTHNRQNDSIMGKLMILLYFILSVFPADATENRRHIHVVRRGSKKLDFNVKRGAMAAYLTDGREVIVPVSMFPDIKHLTKKQREDWMIMDDQYFSFEALSRIYSIKDLLRL